MDDAGASLQAEMTAMGAKAREAASALRLASPEQRTAAIHAMAAAVRDRADAILAANARDVAAARAAGLAPAMVDRLLLDEARLEGVAQALETVAAIPDPVGAETERWTRPNGLDIARVRTPIGVIGIIYESRPNVTADAAALCVRAGNAVILRGGSECLASNLAIHAAVAAGRYPDIRAAASAMGSEPGAVYTPLPENVAAYEELFQEYRALHDYFGRGTNDVMHRLKAIQRRSARRLVTAGVSA
jgi:glutamate-5-semialdehyde dehydrogenase